jgi:hypothetical protein
MQLTVFAGWFRNATAGRERSVLQEGRADKPSVVGKSAPPEMFIFVLCVCVCVCVGGGCGCGCCMFLGERRQHCTKFLRLTEERSVQTLLERLLKV